MDMSSIVAPVIQDRELLEEFADVLNDRAPEIERDVARLRKTPNDRDITASLSGRYITSRAMPPCANSSSALPSPTPSKP